MSGCVDGASLSAPCLVTLPPICKIFLAAWGADPELLVSDKGQIFLIFWLIIVHFGLVWRWHVIRQFRIYLNFLQNFCVHSRPLARSAAHPRLRVLRGLKHGTAGLSSMTLRLGLSLTCLTIQHIYLSIYIRKWNLFYFAWWSTGPFCSLVCPMKNSRFDRHWLQRPNNQRALIDAFTLRRIQ